MAGRAGSPSWSPFSGGPVPADGVGGAAFDRRHDPNPHEHGFMAATCSGLAGMDTRSRVRTTTARLDSIVGRKASMALRRRARRSPPASHTTASPRFAERPGDERAAARRRKRGEHLYVAASGARFQFLSSTRDMAILAAIAPLRRQRCAPIAQ
jgi:hypothetical protein